MKLTDIEKDLRKIESSLSDAEDRKELKDSLVAIYTKINDLTRIYSTDMSDLRDLQNKRETLFRDSVDDLCKDLQHILMVLHKG